jgi:hypothetical protein
MMANTSRLLVREITSILCALFYFFFEESFKAFCWFGTVRDGDRFTPASGSCAS